MAVRAFAGHGQIKFGGNLSVSAGPVGREADGSAYAGDGGVAACYSYSHSRGLFAGISLQGAIFMTRDSDNTRFYGAPVRSSDILKGNVAPPDFEDLKRLYEVLNLVNNPEAIKSGDLPSFADSSGVSFQSSAYSSRFDNDLDDDDIPQATALQWGEDEDDKAFAKAVSETTSIKESDDLLPGWVEVQSDGGQSYYWHEATGKTQWEKPVRAKSVKLPPPPPPPAKSDPDALPPGWVQVSTKDGKPYYWNEEKNITQWERPSTLYNIVATKPFTENQASSASPQNPQSSRSMLSTTSSVNSLATNLQSRSSTNLQPSSAKTSQPNPSRGSSNAPARTVPSNSSTRTSQGPSIETATKPNNPPIPLRPQIPARPSSKKLDNPFESM